ncbi:MAG: hypothetical protein ACREPV_08660 [Lysobacter sp.]
MAKDVTEQYHRYALHPRDLRSIDDLEWICSEYSRRQVTIFDLRIEASGRVVRALFVAYSDGTYGIFRLADLGERERRFVTCKELFHVILDQEPCRNMDLWGHLEETHISFSTEDSSPSVAARTEGLAEVGAMEFLFPYEKRVEELANNGGGGDAAFFAALAAKYGVPQIQIEEYLSDSYMTAFGGMTW